MNVESYHCRLDWVTFSAPSGAEKSKEFRDFGRDLLDRAQGEECPRSRAFQRGYQGEKVGGFSLLERSSDRHCIMTAHGVDADALASEVINNGIEGRTTRLDFAATFKLDKPNPNAASEYRDAIRRYESAQGRKQRAAMGYFEGSRADTGFTLGSRANAVSARFYDFMAKHERDTDWTKWRYEVECKNGAQDEPWERYREAVDKNDICRAVVHGHLQRFGILEPCLAIGHAQKVVGTKEVTTNEKRLIYLEKVVIPMLHNLAQAGLDEEIKSMFAKYGLTDSSGMLLYTTPKRRTFPSRQEKT